MDIEDLKTMLTYLLTLGIGAVAGFFVTFFHEKAKNIAIMQDIGKITEQIESVKYQNNLLLEEVRGRHQLRLAALDRRLQAYQEAYTNWVSLMINLENEEFGRVFKECREWWGENCIYLSQEPRNAFIRAVNRAAMLKELKKYPSKNSDLIKENYELIYAVGEAIERAAELPPLGKEELIFLKNP
jgi:hypothetical protein